MLRRLGSVLAVCAMLAVAMPALAEETQSHTRTTYATHELGNDIHWNDPGVGVTAIIGNVFYVPAKLAYVVLGGIAGGAAYLVTGMNPRPANRIWRSSLGGDYVLTPEMITGRDPIHFMGPVSSERATHTASAEPKSYVQ
jgi:hypothetical protein